MKISAKYLQYNKGETISSLHPFFYCLLSAVVLSVVRYKS